MSVKNKPIVFGYRFVIAVCCLLGIGLSLFGQGGYRALPLNFFSLQSTIFAGFYYLADIVYMYGVGIKNGARMNADFLPRVKGSVITATSLSGLVYNLFVAVDINRLFADYIPHEGSVIIHSVIPLLVLADWILFTNKGNFKRFDPFVWLVFPLYYFIYATVRALFEPKLFPGSRYPYPFLDSDRIGWGGALTYAVVIMLCILILGYVMIFADYIIMKLSLRRKGRK